VCEGGCRCEGGVSRVVNDGVTVAKAVSSADPSRRVGISLLREAARLTDEIGFHSAVILIGQISIPDLAGHVKKAVIPRSFLIGQISRWLSLVML